MGSRELGRDASMPGEMDWTEEASSQRVIIISEMVTKPKSPENTKWDVVSVS